MASEVALEELAVFGDISNQGLDRLANSIKDGVRRQTLRSETILFIEFEAALKELSG